jgi:hypothetical protein
MIAAQVGLFFKLGAVGEFSPPHTPGNAANSTVQPRKTPMKKLRRILSLALLAVSVMSISACTSPTAFEDCGDIPGSNTRCD